MLVNIGEYFQLVFSWLKVLHPQLMSDLCLRNKREDTCQVSIGGKDLTRNSLKEWTSLWVPVHINPNFLERDCFNNQSRSYGNNNSKNIILNAQSILSMLQERHVFPEFSYEYMIDRSFKHVKVIHPFWDHT